jgi:replicative DNA helicase
LSSQPGTTATVRALPAQPAGEGFDRVPPNNLEAEVSVLGSMLLSKDAIAEVAEIIGPEEFYRGAHRTMFEAVKGLYDRGEPVDAVTLADELERRGQLDDVGGALAVTDIVSRVPTAANALYYARIVSGHALRRRLIECGTHITRMGYDTAEEVEQSVDRAEGLVYRMAQHGRVSEFTPIKQLLSAGFERIEQLHESNAAVTGLPTGFADLDELTAGLQPGNLVIIASRPAMGKSTLVTNMCTHVAVEERKSVVLFSLEMSAMELIQRVLAAEAKIDSDRLRTGRLRDDDWPKVSQAIGRLAETRLHIDDTPGTTLMEVRSKCRRLKQKHGLDLIVLDYLQLMQPHRRAENRVQEVAELSRGMKILAKELDVPVIALSQLSRRPEERTDRRPQLSDLRESGSIEQDADIVCFIYRDEVYDPDSAAKGEAELIVAKHRNGPLKTIHLAFLGSTSRFASLRRGSGSGPAGPPHPGAPL